MAAMNNDYHRNIIVDRSSIVPLDTLSVGNIAFAIDNDAAANDMYLRTLTTTVSHSSQQFINYVTADDDAAVRSTYTVASVKNYGVQTAYQNYLE